MEFLEKVKQWVAGFPRWGEAGLTLDSLGPAPENGGLFPRGVELVSAKEDVLGNRKARLRCVFLLQRLGKEPDGADAAWLLDFQQWVYASCAAGVAPSLGEDTRWRAEKGQLAGNKGAGTGLYTVLLTAEFTKEYPM